jgi:hypothetical protein
MRDPELVARAQHAAMRLETAWERWRAAQGLADTPAQPVVGYVGYGLKEPWSQPRAVIGFSADEAERLAEHLESGMPAAASSAAPAQPKMTTRSAVQQWSGSEPEPELAADRSLPVPDLAHRVIPASGQEPARTYGVRGFSSAPHAASGFGTARPRPEPRRFGFVQRAGLYRGPVFTGGPARPAAAPGLPARCRTCSGSRRPESS